MGDLRILKHQGLRAGVYIFRNLINLKSYVGSSVHLYTRLANYFYIKNSPGKVPPIIGRALAKYTHSNFKLLGFLVSSTDSEGKLPSIIVTSFLYCSSRTARL